MTTAARGRSRAALTALLAGVLAVLLATPASAQEQAFTVRDSDFSEDGTTTITVSVGEELAEPLSAGDVQVVEDGTAIQGVEVQPIGETEVEAPPIAVALVIDTSGSTEGEPLAAAKEAATGFLANLVDVQANIVLVEFNDTASVAAPMTTDLGSLNGPINALEAEGETALYDAVVLAANELAAVDAQRTILVFSDGADTVSEANQQQAIQAATNNEAPITSVILASEDLDVESLESLATGSGGSAITVDNAEDVAAAFETVATELTNQYVISYTSEITDPSELNVELTVALPSGQTTQNFTVINPRQAAPEVVEPPRVDNEAGVLASPVVLALGLLAGFLALVGIIGFLVMSPRSKASKHLERELTTYVEGGKRRPDSSAVAEALRRRASAVLEASPSGAEFQSRVQKMLDQGQIPLKTVELLAVMVVGAMLLGTIGFVTIGLRAVFVFAPVGLLAPWLIMIIRRSRRLSRFLEMLPDTLQLIAGSLSAGYGVLQSIDMVTKESEDPMSTEFNRVLVESRLGMPLEDSLEAMADRMDSDDFRWVVLAMNIQREVGGNLAQLMQTVATTLRDREALRRHISALSAEGKLSAIVLVLLPFFLAGYLILVNPGYVGTLTESLIGWLLIGFGSIAMIVGIIWIRGLIRAIEV